MPPPPPPFSTPTSRHLALLTHNPLSHSSFVYCVLTTKIYCRPTCAARPARRANIIFHNTSADAAHAGFRACKRCRPELDCYDPQKDVVRRVCARIESVVREEEEGGRRPSREELGLDVLAEEAGWTKAHFQRVFKRVAGVSPRVYAERLRVVGRGGEGLGWEEGRLSSLESLDGGSSTCGSDESPATPADVSLAASTKEGVADTNVGDSSGQLFLSNPARTSCKNIEFTVQPWFSSFVLIATSSCGICALESDESPQELAKGLRDRFPDAKFTCSPWFPGPATAVWNANASIYSAVMEALVNPTGKTLDVPWDIN